MDNDSIYSAMGADGAWQAGHLGSPDVRVAVFDSGIDTREGARAHLRRKVDYGWDLTGGHEPRGWLDRDGHGTMMAALVAANHLDDDPVHGIAPRIRLLNFRVVDGDGRVAGDDAITAGMALLFGESRQRKRVHVALLAIETGSQDAGVREALRDAVARVGEAGVLVVVSAGDGSDPLPDRELADLDNVLVVGAVDGEGTYRSNADPDRVHLAAPGGPVRTVGPYGPARESGSSPAAAFVAGAAALAFSSRPDATPGEVARWIRDRCRPLPSLEGKVATGGMLDLRRLLEI